MTQDGLAKEHERLSLLQIQAEEKLRELEKQKEKASKIDHEDDR